MARVELRNVSKSFGEAAVLRGCSLVAADGELVVLVGASGCGKSTILRLVAGLESPDDGDILIADQRVNEIPPMDRDIAMVFQDYALYPHMTVRENLGFGLRMRRKTREFIAAKISEVADMLDIAHLLDRLPRDLSGGQRQRVAMGRALVRDPSVFLLDEPLSNLDAQLRSQVRGEIRRLHDRLGATMIHVTHDQVEAMSLADRLVVLRNGEIEQSGAPSEIYERPRTSFVAGFIGSPAMNFLTGQFSPGAGAHSIMLKGGAHLGLPATSPRGAQAGTAKAVLVGLRSEAITVMTSSPKDGLNSIPGVVIMLEHLGAETLCTLDIGSETLVARIPADLRLSRGERVFALADMTRAHLFDPVGGNAL